MSTAETAAPEDVTSPATQSRGRLAALDDEAQRRSASIDVGDIRTRTHDIIRRIESAGQNAATARLQADDMARRLTEFRSRRLPSGAHAAPAVQGARAMVAAERNGHAARPAFEMGDPARAHRPGRLPSPGPGPGRAAPDRVIRGSALTLALPFRLREIRA
ncbi:hypothetical protein [Nonomuraea sp. NPDC050643]|uniref:hypothetical protein n=1 Tax=Nonomuraea sp. NPDC050643 TaxID=3155660 RepID=UPI0033E96772